jgi:hypothetical protein
MTVTRSGPGIAVLKAALSQLDGIEGKTGWFETAHYPGGPPVAYVATIQEFGTERIPPRPFMRPAVADDGSKWLNTLAGAAKVVLTGGMSASDAMEITVLQAASDVGKHIDAVVTPGLAPSTLANRARRGNKSSKPLEDTKQMLMSVTGKVEAKGS